VIRDLITRLVLICRLVLRWILLSAGVVLALSACAEPTGGGIDIIDVSGPLDRAALEFITDSIEHGADTGQELAVVQLNSKAVLDEEAFDRLADLIGTPPLPVAMWVGPAPAAAYGAAADLPHLASHAAMAPGAFEGHYAPRILGVDDDRSNELLAAEESGLPVQPALRQYIQDLDGATFHTTEGPVTVSTLTEFGDGVTVKTTTLRKPGLATRFFRLAVTPEAAFFFVAIGLTIAVFEFYALGPGVAAGVAAISLLIGGWGVVTLPVNWWAMALIVVGFLFLVAAHQSGGIFVLTLIGAIVLQGAGVFLIDGGGQIDPRWWLVLPTVAGVLFFFLLAMPTVQRARLSTETIGRNALIGESGVALVDFDPDGLVEVGGARWRGTAHREASISRGDPIEVTGVDGLYLEVERQVTARET
jgi:membrane-bound ClpP family serine protease